MIQVNRRKIDLFIGLVFKVAENEFRKFDKFDELRGVMGEQTDEALRQSGLSKAVLKYVETMDLASVEQMTFAQKVELSTIALWEQAKAFWATPFGKAAIIAGAIFLIIKVVEGLTVSLEEQREKLTGLKDEYDEVASRLETLNNELETTKKRIEELQALQNDGTITLAQAEELKLLQSQNRELTRKIALETEYAKHKQEEVNNAFLQTYAKDLGATNTNIVNGSTIVYDGLGYGSFVQTYGTEKDYLEQQLQELASLRIELASASDKATSDALEAQIEEIESYLLDRSKQFETDIDGVTKTDSTAKTLDEIADFQDRIAISLGLSGSKENAIWRLLDEQFVSVRDNLKALGDQSTVTSALLSDPAYDAFIAKLLELGVISADDEENLSFVALAFKEVAAMAAQEATPSLSDLAETLTKIKSAMDLLTTAEEEMKSGGLTADTIKALADETDNYLDFLYVENGLVRLNTEAWQTYIDTLQGNNTVSIESRITSLKNERSSILSDIESLKGIKSVSDTWNIDEMEGVMHYSEWNSQMDTLNKKLADNETAIAKAEEELEIYTITQESAAKATEDTTKAVNAQVKAMQGAKTVADAMGVLSSIYSDVQDGDTFDWSSIIDNDEFSEAFSNLGDVYTNFITTIGNSSDDIDACQEAFNRLASAYIMNSSGLEEVTEATRDAVIAMLEQNGVSNATEIVEAQLINNRIALADTTDNLADSIGYYISALYGEEGASEAATQAAAALQLQKYLVNVEQIKTTSDIEQLIALANAAGATVESLARLEQAKRILAGVSASQPNFTGIETNISKYKPAQIAYDGYDGGSGISMEDALAEVQALLSTPIKYNGLNASDFSVSFNPYVGGSTSASGSSGSSNSDNWFERQYALHQHLLEMDAEETKDYLTWLNVAYKQAYNEGIITLDDYYNYTAEVYKGLQDLYMEHLSDKEHEISMRKNYENEAATILKIYRDLVDDVSAEIAKARSAGLDDNDDYLQGLLDKYWEYTNAIKEMQEEATANAKDAVDELVDLRIDMLKRELENQKDSLNERLDALKDFYDKQKEMLQDVYDEEKYLEEQAEKRKTVSDIQASIDMLENDDSAWAQKRRIELEEELTDAKKELDDFEKDHALETTQTLLDEQLKLQEEQINSEIESIDKELENAKSLYEQALEDIRNGSVSLYEDMLAYNAIYGDGIDANITQMWEAAYVALEKYYSLYNELYDGVHLDNATGYQAPTDSWDSNSVASGGNQIGTPNHNKSETDESPAQSAPALIKGSYVEVKPGTTWYGDSYGGGSSGVARNGKILYINESGSHPYNIEGLGWIKRTDIVGYASGTRNATAGLHRIDEYGPEYVFTSPSDGTRYRLLNGGDKVLNAKATNFLYNFATSGGEIISKLFGNAVSALNLERLIKPVQQISIETGNIIIEGNADQKTVSQIRREQRENTNYILKEFQRLSR